MLWYVAQDGRLVPQLVLPEAERARLARLPGGLLQADGLVSLSADKVVNTGYILSGGTLAVDADELANLKRNAYYYEKRKVDGGELTIEGDVVQPGGFMQALHWSLGADEVDSRSGEFRVLGADEAATQEASAAFIEEIAASLGEDYHYEEAADRLTTEFKPNKKKGGLGGLIGAVVGIVVAIVATPAVSAWIAGAAGATGTTAVGSAWAATTASAGAGFANAAATSFVTGTLGSAAGQLAATGKVDLDAALRNGAVTGLTAGITGAAFGQTSADSLAGITNQGGTLQPVAGGSAEWADRLLGIGARGVIGASVQSAVNGTSFDTALRDAIAGDLAAVGANEIGAARLDTVSHALSHAALGAIAAELTGKDPAAGAIGALTSALAAKPIDVALGLTGTSRQVAVTALAMLSGGALADALGYDALTAGNAALNEVTNNYLKHDEAVELQRLRERCALGRCGDAERAEIKRLESLDRMRNQQIESACRNPSSLECQTAYLDLARALSSYDGKRIEPGSVGDRELSELVGLDDKFRQRIANSMGYNATTGISETLAQGLAATVELALLTVKATFGDADAQRRLAELVDATGEFLEHPIDNTERGIKSTLDEADRLDAAGRTDEAQRLRAGLVSDGLLAITGAGAIVVKGSGKVLGTLSRAKGSAFDSAVLTKDEVQQIVAQNKIENYRTADGTALDFPREIRTSSGIVIRANPDKTTTVLGRFALDTESILNLHLDRPIGAIDLGPSRPGVINILNVAGDVVNRLGETRFWNEINRPFLDAAIARGDDIVLATKPDPVNLISKNGTLTMFGREVFYLERGGFRYDSTSGKMVLKN